MENGIRRTPELRREPVRLALTSSRTLQEIAEDLGMGLSTLTRWLVQASHGSEASDVSVDLHAELKCFCRANVVLKCERDIFEKAALTG